MTTRTKKKKVDTESPYAHLINAKVSDQLTANKNYLVWVETTEEEQHLIDTRHVPTEILETIEGLE